MLLLGAIGDSYGAAYKLVCRENQYPNDLKYRLHPELPIGNGRYTGNTQLALAVAEVLLSDDWSQLAFANAFVDCYHRDPRRNYISYLASKLEISKTGQDLLDIQHDPSDRSACITRATITGILPDYNDVVEITKAQTEISHNTPAAQTASKLAALTFHFFAYSLGKSYELIPFLEDAIKDKLDWIEHPPKNSNSAISCIHSVIDIVKSENFSYKDNLRKVISNGGDCDTVATSVMYIMAAKAGTINDLPLNLYDEIEEGDFGKSYLTDISKRLSQRFNLNVSK